MIRYETLLLTIPEITSDECVIIERFFDNLVKKYNGSIVSFERWGKYRLAYPVRKNEYGVYFLVRFDVNDANMLAEIKNTFDVKYAREIMRYMTTRLPLSTPLTYKRPESVDDIPAQDVDEFLRKNKMEGLLSSTGKKEGIQQKETHLEE